MDNIASYLKYYPLINEVVLILTTSDKTIYDTGFNTTYYLPSVNIWNHPHHNALPNLNDLRINDADQQADYEETVSGIVRRNFLFILYRPTLPRSYRLGSKNLVCKSC